MTRPNYLEITLGAFLHDIGKLAQRAHGGRQHLPERVRQFEGDILPQWEGRPTHIHALWSEYFFHRMEEQGLSFPAGINRSTVRNAAVFHHKPDAVMREIGAAAWIVAEADRLASGLDRKTRDEEQERRGTWDQFIKTPMLNPFSTVWIAKDLGETGVSYLPLEPLHPGEEAMPVRKVSTERFPEKYKAVWSGFETGFAELCEVNRADLFIEGLNELAGRLLHAVPSSTVDQPDVSLYDHSRATAAIAGALWRFHEHEGTSEDGARIRDRDVKKFRFLVGDLSGIQSTLFQLARERVKGVNKILRARSFFLGMVLEGAALECMRGLEAGAFSRLQSAGGRFLLLMPATEDLDDRLQEVRGRVEGWLMERWRGELALNLSLTPAFAGRRLFREGYADLQAMLGATVEEAKLRPLHSAYRAMHTGDRYEYGVCAACGVRPALERRTEDDELRCSVCAEEVRLGADLPKLAAVTWSRQPAGAAAGSIRMWGDLRMNWHKEMPPLNSAIEAGFRLWSGTGGQKGGLPLRFLGNYVPRMGPEEVNQPRYHGLSEEAGAVQEGELKLFEHLAADALEVSDGEVHGEDLLAVMKADVDRLGAVFGQGVKAPSLGMLAGLSRMMDFFFAGYLPELLRRDARFQSTYMVYAGGDDLLLIGPWRQMCQLAGEVRQKFAQWTGGNPQLTISAALELTHCDEPLNRSASAAEERLERAKGAGRNRICAFVEEPMEWTEFDEQAQKADRLRELLAAGTLSQAFVYRMLWLDSARLKVERNGKVDLAEVGWRAKWGYQLQRNVMENRRLKPEQKQELQIFLNGLLGLDREMRKCGGAPSARAAISMAVYRNRKGK